MKLQARWQESKGQPWSQWGSNFYMEQTSPPAKLALQFLALDRGGWDGKPVKLTVEREGGFRTQYRLSK